jgi:glycosyltransferase involved in cell wall biosynthesis
MKADLIAHGFHLSNVELIPNGVEINHFSPKRIDSTGDKKGEIVICLARLTYQKGIDVLLQAWSLLSKQAPQARLIIAGSGPLQPQLERMAQALDILDSVEFVGLQGDVQSLLHESNVAVLPSRWEGMPVAILEAMACGLPCVASYVSGSEDIIQHGVNGLLVEPEDYRGLAEALLTLLRDPALAQQYGNAARVTIEKHYSLERITDKYIELYGRITSSEPQIRGVIQSSES